MASRRRAGISESGDTASLLHYRPRWSTRRQRRRVDRPVRGRPGGSRAGATRWPRHVARLKRWRRSRYAGQDRTPARPLARLSSPVYRIKPEEEVQSRWIHQMGVVRTVERGRAPPWDRYMGLCAAVDNSHPVPCRVDDRVRAVDVGRRDLRTAAAAGATHGNPRVSPGRTVIDMERERVLHATRWRRGRLTPRRAPCRDRRCGRFPWTGLRRGDGLI
jgi:hypothetical protein